MSDSRKGSVDGEDLALVSQLYSAAENEGIDLKPSDTASGG